MLEVLSVITKKETVEQIRKLQVLGGVKTSREWVTILNREVKTWECEAKTWGREGVGCVNISENIIPSGGQLMQRPWGGSGWQWVIARKQIWPDHSEWQE